MLRIAKTSIRPWCYHVVKATTEGLSSGELVGVCGEFFRGKETYTPVATWGVKDHLPSHYCPGCSEQLRMGAADP